MNANQAEASAQYDGELQMYCDNAREADRATLRFLRWMAEHGRLEHEISGPSTGEYVEVTVEQAGR